MNRFSSPTFVSRLILLAALATASLTGCLTNQLEAASVTSAGYTNAFTTQPPASDWSYASITGDANTYGTVAAMDAGVQAIAPNAITTQTLLDAADPPALNAAATWSSSGLYLQTRPTGNAATLLMLTLVNNMGLDPGVLSVSYDFNNATMAGEGLDGHRVYYRTAASASWIPVPSLSFPTPGRVVGNVDVSWPVGSTLYLLWADDNGSPSPDSACQIDNISVKRGTAVPVSITQQPQDVSAIVGSAASLVVMANGTSPTYQWQRENPADSGTWVNISGATTTNYVISPAQLSNTGRYRVIVSNSLGSVTSLVAYLTVDLDRFGPRMTSAVVSDTSSNQIRLQWDERLSGGTASVLANYVLTPLGSTVRVPIQFITYNPGPPSQTTITIAPNSGSTITNNWYPGGATNYILTVNNIRDVSASNNVIAPNSQIAISWPIITNVFPASQVWQYHTSWAFDDLYNTNNYPVPWYQTNFTGLGGFATGIGPFYKDLFLANSCLGPFQTEIGYQRQPSLFRTWFNWPAGSRTNANLRLKFTVDDGAVFYLNGTEVAGSRYNVAPGDVNNANARAIADIGDPGCNTNTITVNNLRPGTSNLFCVAILQSTDNNQSDIVFGMQMDVVSFKTGTAPTNALPILITNLVNFRVGGTNKFRFDWKANGYALESTVVPGNVKVTGTNHYPGPWFEVQPNMTNPYTNQAPTNPGDPFRVYRLHKVNHGTP